MESDTTPLGEQAALWWITLHEGEPTRAEVREFAEWIAKSPERVEAYLRVTLLMRALAVSDLKWPKESLDELVRQASTQSNVRPLEVRGAEEAAAPRQSAARPAVASYGRAPSGHDQAEARQRRRWPGFAFATAALTMCLAVGMLLWHQLYGIGRYATALGEQRSVLLSDGSLVTLNTATAIEVKLTEGRRLVHLHEGEALFQVTHDPTRPFDVIAGDATIRAVGTQFNVDRRARRTTVTVVEGKVLVDEAPVAAAERVVVTRARVSAPEKIANLAPVTAWMRRQLIFDRRPLGEVAEEFNRYNRRHIVIEDERLRSERVTGAFQANDPDSFMSFLEQIPGIDITVNADGDRVVKWRGPN